MPSYPIRAPAVQFGPRVKTPPAARTAIPTKYSSASAFFRLLYKSNRARNSGGITGHKSSRRPKLPSPPEPPENMQKRLRPHEQSPLPSLHNNTVGQPVPLLGRDKPLKGFPLQRRKPEQFAVTLPS